MYPFLRLAYQGIVARRMPPLAPGDVHVSHHVCWPWDLDLWWELNNGRTLTIFDLGRIPMAIRTGLIDMLRAQRWGLTVAGSVVRYRRRVRMFDRLEIRSRLLGWDARFMYVEQAMWNSRGDCTSHAVYRSAVTDASGIVATERVRAAMGLSGDAPEMPGWVRDCFAAEDRRPWPPEMPEGA